MGEPLFSNLLKRSYAKSTFPTIDELAAEKRRQAKSQWGWSFERAYPGWDFIRTGEFSFEIENQYLDGFRRSWRDGKQQRLEDLIEDISIGLVAYAAGAKLRREEWEKRERNWERQSRVRARAEQRQRREEDRAKILDELVAVSDEASKLRRWLSEAEKRARPEKPNEFTQFVVWAKERPAYLEHCVNAEGIAETLKSRDLFPETDPLVDPPDDLVEE